MSVIITFIHSSIDHMSFTHPMITCHPLITCRSLITCHSAGFSPKHLYSCGKTTTQASPGSEKPSQKHEKHIKQTWKTWKNMKKHENKNDIFQGAGFWPKHSYSWGKTTTRASPGSEKTSPKHEKNMKNIQNNQKISDQTRANKIEKTIKHKRLASGNTRFPGDV